MSHHANSVNKGTLSERSDEPRKSTRQPLPSIDDHRLLLKVQLVEFQYFFAVVRSKSFKRNENWGCLFKNEIQWCIQQRCLNFVNSVSSLTIMPCDEISYT